MKLFEAEELKKAFVNKGQRSRRYHVGDVWELNFKEICEVLDDMPTVEAIPIDFIKQTIADKRYILARASEKTAPYYEHAVRALEMLLWEWGKENGRS